MITTIVLIWVAMQLQAPLWVYVAVVTQGLLQILDFVLHIALKVQKKKLKKAVDELADTAGRLMNGEDE